MPNERIPVFERVEIRKNSEGASFDTKKKSKKIAKHKSCSELQESEEVFFDAESLVCNNKMDSAEKYEELCERYTQLQSDHDALQINYNEMQSKQDLMEGIIIKLSKKLEYLEDNIVDLRSRSMQDNIIISNCPETPSGNSQAEMIKIIKDNLDVTVKPEEVYKAHRIGAPAHATEVNPRPRPLVAKLNPKAKDRVMKNTQKLTGKNIYINQQKPEALKEKDKLLRFRVKMAKKRYREDVPHGQEAEVVTRNGKLYVNKQLKRYQVCTPSTEMILQTDHEERQRLSRLKMKSTDSIRDGGSCFYGYGLKAHSYDEVQRQYMKVKLQHPSADDVMCSFSIADEFGHQVVELHDDKECGGASRIFSAIQDAKATDVAIFVVRYFNGTHIGKKRFEHIKKAASDVLKKLNA